MVIRDVYDLWEQEEARLQAQLDCLPVCSSCGQPIQDFYCYNINGKDVCKNCLNEYYIRWI